MKVARTKTRNLRCRWRRRNATQRVSGSGSKLTNSKSDQWWLGLYDHSTSTVIAATVIATLSMSQIQSRQTDPERGDNTQAVTGIFAISTPYICGFTAFKGGGHHPHEQPRSASNLPVRPQQGDHSFGDSSGPTFSMYSKLAKEEDDVLVDRWQ